jgi:uncharacterized protein YggE
MMKRLAPALPTALLTVAVAAAGRSDAQAPAAADPAATATLRAIGQAEVRAKPDRLRATLAIVTGGATAAEAIQTNNDRMQTLVQLVSQIGLSNEEYETGTLRIDPIYENERTRWTKRGMIGRLTGFQVVNALEIDTPSLDLLEKLIETTVEGGVNRIDRIGFALGDPESTRDEAIRLATRRARHDAEVMAGAADVQIVRIRSIELTETSLAPSGTGAGRGLGRAFAVGGSTAGAAAGVGSAGSDITVRAEVKVVFEIAPRQ